MVPPLDLPFCFNSIFSVLKPLIEILNFNKGGNQEPRLPVTLVLGSRFSVLGSPLLEFDISNRVFNRGENQEPGTKNQDYR